MIINLCVNSNKFINEISSKQEPLNQIEDRTKLNKGLAHMLKGGVIMDVVNVQQAKLAENSNSSLLGSSIKATLAVPAVKPKVVSNDSDKRN